MKVLFLALVCMLAVDSTIGLMIHEVKIGETAILPCPSDDKLHRFQYWQLKDDEIVGPWNNNLRNKYRYEVWSGKLIIRVNFSNLQPVFTQDLNEYTEDSSNSVSESESGSYKCFSKHILGPDLRSETVELLVKRDWEDSFENDSKVNVYRAVIAVLVLLMLIMVGIFAFFIKRRRSPVVEVGNSSREGSPEELIPPVESKGVYRPTNISLSKPSTSKQKFGFENAIVETDISTSFSLN